MRGWLRAMVCVPTLYPADPMANAKEIAKNLRKAEGEGTDLIVFPELCLTGASLGDLYRTESLLQETEKALLALARDTKDCRCLAVVGAPMRARGSVLDAFFLLRDGKIEVSTARSTFTAQEASTTLRALDRAEASAPTILEFSDPSCRQYTFRLALCAFSELLQGAFLEEWDRQDVDLICVPSALSYTAGAEKRHRQICQTLSERGYAILLASAGEEESGADYFYAGERAIFEGGKELLCGGILGHPSRRYGDVGDGSVDIDLDRLQRLREEQRSETRMPSNRFGRACEISVLDFSDWEAERDQRTLDRPYSAHPLVPSLEEREEILEIQTRGLLRRMRHLRTNQVWIGLSGGLDSTLAMLVALRAFEQEGWEKKGLHLVSMPAFGTGTRTRSNASKLGEAAGCDFREISLTKVLQQHFSDIALAPEDRSVAYENAQARERTRILMDLANAQGGLQVGTGDLSEAALGWSTYNGDQMSMYNPNATISKTLAQALVADEAKRRADLRPILEDILATPISPELLPGEEGKIVQKTEEIIGSYELHDFFLYYFLRYGYEPYKITKLAEKAFAGQYDRRVILRTEKIFFDRFFAGQFKRSCAPEGVATGLLSFSPREGWRIPSDISGAWIRQELDRMWEEVK